MSYFSETISITIINMINMIDMIKMINISKDTFYYEREKPVKIYPLKMLNIDNFYDNYENKDCYIIDIYGEFYDIV